MEGKALILLALAAVAIGSPIEERKMLITPALRSYTEWAHSAAQVFLNGDLTSEQVHQLDQQNTELQQALMTAIESQESEPLDKQEVEKNLLAALESGMIGIENDKVLGLMLGHDDMENYGARIAVSARVFEGLSNDLQTIVNGLETEEVDSDILDEITEKVLAMDIAFDAVVSNFYKVEDIVNDAEDSVDESETTALPETETTPVTAETEATPETADTESEAETVSRQKRQVQRRQNGFNLGGGFSTNGRSISYNRGRTTVTATPHVSFKPRPQFHGATGSFQHRFKNGRGSVFGSATVNNRGRFTGGQVGVRIRF